MIEDAKFDSEVNKEAEERILSQHRRSSIKNRENLKLPQLDEDDTDLILANEWAKDNLSGKDNEAAILSSTLMVSLRSGLQCLSKILPSLQVRGHHELELLLLSDEHQFVKFIPRRRPKIRQQCFRKVTSN